MTKFLTGLVAVAIVGSVASADIIISNLPGNDGSQTAGINGTTRTKGMGFAMPAGTDYVLTSVTARLNITDLGVNPRFEIFDDNAGEIGTLIMRLNNPAFGALGIAEFDFTPGSALTLVGGRSYWVVGSSEVGVYDWKASSPSEIPTGVASHTGVKWGSYIPTGSSSILTSYAVNGTVVPAPASLALLSLGGLVAIRRRR